MHRPSIIFVSLLLTLAVAIVAAGYVTQQGPLAIVSIGISRLTSGGQMIPSRTVVEEIKAPAAPEISNALWINSEPLLRLTVLHNIPTVCNRVTADFLISSPLFSQSLRVLRIPKRVLSFYQSNRSYCLCRCTSTLSLACAQSNFGIVSEDLVYQGAWLSFSPGE
jgi:hypothetical protein